VEEKAVEGGFVVLYVSSFRNSRMCPIHFAKLKNGGGWHALHCPRGHAVDRDAAAVLNMLWKTTPTGWVKGVWWDVKEARKRLKKGIVPRETVRKTNPIISHRSTAYCTRRLGLPHGAEGQPPVARGAGSGRTHEPRRRGW
jgi:putative transposase